MALIRLLTLESPFLAKALLGLLKGHATTRGVHRNVRGMPRGCHLSIVWRRVPMAHFKDEWAWDYATIRRCETPLGAYTTTDRKRGAPPSGLVAGRPTRFLWLAMSGCNSENLVLFFEKWTSVKNVFRAIPNRTKLEARLQRHYRHRSEVDVSP